MSEDQVAEFTPYRLKPNGAELGKRIRCPDGEGKIRSIISPDNVIIELDRKSDKGQPLLAKFDLSDCMALELHTPPVPKELTEEQLNQPIMAATTVEPAPQEVQSA